MKILHVVPPMGPSYGGPFLSVRRLAQAQQALGMEVKVRMPWSAEAEAHLEDWRPVDVNAEGKVWVKALEWSPAFSKEWMQTEADVLHTHGLWQHPSWGALGWKRRHRGIHVISVRGMLEEWSWNHKAWKKRPMWWLFEKRNLQSATFLHATAPQETAAIRARGITTPVVEIPNGVDVPPWRDAGESRAAAHEDARSSTDNGQMTTDKRQVSADNRARKALFLSRIHPKKGLPMLLEAWDKLRPQGWCLQIVGPDEGGHVAELKAMVARMGLQEQVSFHEPMIGEAKGRIFWESDLFVLPTHSENFGIAVAEALAHQLPVITTHGAPWSELEEERCGWWVPVSVEGIASALAAASTQTPAQLREMGLRGRKLVEERYSWERVGREMVAAYGGVGEADA